MHYIVLAALLFIAACAPYSRVPAAERIAIKAAFTVQPDIAWNRFTPIDEVTQTASEVWTADGQLLNSITFFAGIADGEPLVRRRRSEEKLPAFRRDMTPTDIMEMVEATLGKVNNFALTKTRDLRPAAFGGVDGFRFELSMVGKDNVDREAMAAGAVRGGKLYLVVYQGTRLHHFGLRREQAERIIESVRFASG